MAEGLVETVRVEGQFANLVPVGVENSDLGVGDEQGHSLAGKGAANGDVAEAAEVAEADSAATIDAVVTGPEVGDGNRVFGAVLEAGVKCDQRRPAVECAVWSLLVVVAAEAVELELENGSRGGRGLFGQELLEGLMESARPCRRSEGGRGWSACPGRRGARVLTPRPPCRGGSWRGRRRRYR